MYLDVAVSLGVVYVSEFSSSLAVLGVRPEHTPSTFPLTANYSTHL